jgi:hypothetical protein
MVIAEAQECHIDLNNLFLPTTTPLATHGALAPASPPLTDTVPQIMTVDHIPTTEGPSHMFKHFLVDGTPVMMLVDTGAVHSLAHHSALSPAQVAAVTQPPHPVHYVGASGHRLDTIGQAVLSVERDGDAYNTLLQ